MTALASLLLPLACTGDYMPPPTSEGELGRGEFIYRCTGQSDALCPVGAQQATSFPQAVALGGEFGLDYTYKEEFDGDPLPTLKSSSSERIELTNGIFKGSAEGYTAILAVSGASEVIDIKHIRVTAVDHLTISQDQIEVGPQVEVEAGRTIKLTASPQSSQDQLLGGALDYWWTSADASVAKLSGAGTDDLVAIQGVAEGTTQFTVKVGQVTQSVMVKVLPSVSSGSDSDSDGTTDTDTSTTGDTDTSTTGDTDASTTGDTDTDTTGDTTGDTTTGG